MSQSLEKAKKPQLLHSKRSQFYFVCQVYYQVKPQIKYICQFAINCLFDECILYLFKFSSTDKLFIHTNAHTHNLHIST